MTTVPKFFRILAVALLALTIPVQGMAAVTVGQCMAFEHHQDGAGHEPHGHTADGASGHDHAAHSHNDDVSKQGGDTSHCGPCTACCASASIAGPAGLAIPTSASNAPYVFSQFPPLGVQPDGLFRPPLAL
jgi:hypothetical protein